MNKILTHIKMEDLKKATIWMTGHSGKCCMVNLGKDNIFLFGYGYWWMEGYTGSKEVQAALIKMCNRFLYPDYHK
jgi:hypothetical protein